jgi:hypothetical protein
MVISWSGLFLVVVTRARSHLGMIVAEGNCCKAESATGDHGHANNPATCVGDAARRVRGAPVIQGTVTSLSRKDR